MREKESLMNAQSTIVVHSVLAHLILLVCLPQAWAVSPEESSRKTRIRAGLGRTIVDVHRPTVTTTGVIAGNAPTQTTRGTSLLPTPSTVGRR